MGIHMGFIQREAGPVISLTLHPLRILELEYKMNEIGTNNTL
jgi:hypothetical protein